MFRRENRKSFGETEKLFWSKPSIQKGFGTRQELFVGYRKCSGTFRNFSGENAREKHSVPDGGQDPTNGGAVLYGAPLMTQKCRGSQQSSREVFQAKFIDSTQGEPKNIYKP